MSVAIFPGSFDPVTNGHVDVIEQAAAIFDKVYVVVMVNTAKKYLFKDNERQKLCQAAVKNLPNVEVLLKPDQLTVNVARDLHANVIVRGVRNTTDFLFEQQIAEMNRKMANDISTVLLFTKPENSYVASSIIKEIAQFNGVFNSFLPNEAAKALKEKFS